MLYGILSLFFGLNSFLPFGKNPRNWKSAVPHAFAMSTLGSSSTPVILTRNHHIRPSSELSNHNDSIQAGTKSFSGNFFKNKIQFFTRTPPYPSGSPTWRLGMKTKGKEISICHYLGFTSPFCPRKLILTEKKFSPWTVRSLNGVCSSCFYVDDFKKHV